MGSATKAFMERLRRRSGWTVGAAALMMVPAVLVGSASAAATVVGCGAVIRESTTLAADVGPCPGYGLIIVGDDITLDLNGHRVSGDPQVRQSPDKPGLLLRGVRGVTVRGGTVEGFDAGVVILGGGTNTVRNVTARDNVNYRVVTGRDSQRADVVSEDGPFCDLGDGIAVFGSGRNIVKNNDIVGNGPFSGVSLIGASSDNVVSGNRFLENDVLNHTPQGWGTICGADIDGPADNPPPFEPPPDPPIDCCATTGRHVQDIGVRVEGPGAKRNIIDANQIRMSGLMGIMVHGYNTMMGAPSNSSTVIRKNHITETAKVGHDLDRQGHGIYVHQPGPPFVFASPHTLIEGNVSSGNYGGGIFLDSKGTLHSTIVRNNAVNRNGLDGLYVNGPGSAAGSPNRLVNNVGHGNGDRAEEVNNGPDFRANYFGTDGSDSSVGCVRNIWSGNQFGTVNQRCVKADGGTGAVIAPASPQPAQGAQSSLVSGSQGGDGLMHRGVPHGNGS